MPDARKNTRGITWANGVTPGRTIPISDFFVAKPSDSVREINSQLARGKNLLLTPGVYDIARSIEVKWPNQVVLGLGHATLTAVNGATPLEVGDVPGVVVAGVTVDAGLKESPVLLRVGKKRGWSWSSPHNPTTLSDVYFRAGYKVGNRVKKHTLHGAGVYVFNQNNPAIHTENGFEVPQTPGVKLRHIMTVNLGAGTIDHVVNGVGDAADTTKVGQPVYIKEYPAP
ncbi:hypothetical protein JOF56_005451 [Kibdelosporangium banguiense]|uniref:Uncharacterized protein n=1 Tax=Kibdelosporangium banguiense TaxID=1365924 RepID=A0ABS4TKX6_9PSEU|nr:hypothetical protein [Kibdelosporangium banguiense]MBP2325066.1 hypothetical protein [Kibdelosporangium banguiense]